MVIKLLFEGYKSDDQLYTAFCQDNIWSSDFISNDYVSIPTLPDFPIYFAKMRDDEKVKGLLELIHMIEDNILTLDRDIYMDERFWHSYLCLYKRDFLIQKYPEILENINAFKNIILKPFDWENYIYKAILTAQYVVDHAPSNQKEHYYHLIIQNMDIFNYIIKYEIFRNGNFLINVLDIIEKHDLSKILKAKIKDRPDLGKDERYGRRVIFEFNKSYPIVLSPMLEKQDLEAYFLKFLSYYYHGETIQEPESMDLD